MSLLWLTKHYYNFISFDRKGKKKPNRPLVAHVCTKTTFDSTLIQIQPILYILHIPAHFHALIMMSENYSKIFHMKLNMKVFTQKDNLKSFDFFPDNRLLTAASKFSSINLTNLQRDQWGHSPLSESDQQQCLFSNATGDAACVVKVTYKRCFFLRRAEAEVAQTQQRSVHLEAAADALGALSCVGELIHTCSGSIAGGHLYDSTASSCKTSLFKDTDWGGDISLATSTPRLRAGSVAITTHLLYCPVELLPRFTTVVQSWKCNTDNVTSGI